MSYEKFLKESVEKQMMDVRKALNAPPAPKVPQTSSPVRSDALDKLRSALDLPEADETIAMLNAAVRIRRLTEEAKAQAVPEGWKLVPIDPTPEMRAAIINEVDRQETGWQWNPVLIHAAMLAAAPQPPAPSEPFHIGACITDGRLHVTVMRREGGVIHVLATAEMDAESLKTHDGHAVMAPAPSEPTDEQISDAIESAFSATGEWPEGDVAVVRAWLKYGSK